MTVVDRRSLLASLGAGLLSAPAFRSAAAAPAAAPAAGLAKLAADRGVLFGTAVNHASLGRYPALTEILRADAAIVVPEWELKWASLRPSPTAFDFAKADSLLDFAGRNRLAVRGHALLWHEALPRWFAGLTKQETGRLVADHIGTVARRYAGRLHSWDVVNEPINPRDGLPGGLRNSPFYQALGPSYLETALDLAAAGDPSARLVINDYNLEMQVPEHEARRQAMLALLAGLVRRRIPVHALGIQAHLDAGGAPFDPARFRAFLRAVGDLGLAVYITELDVNDRLLGPDPAARDMAVAEVYRTFLGAALAEPVVKVVMLWGVSDLGTWLNDSPNARRRDGLPIRGLPYDDQFRPKRAWSAIRDALLEAPVRS